MRTIIVNPLSIMKSLLWAFPLLLRGSQAFISSSIRSKLNYAQNTHSFLELASQKSTPPYDDDSVPNKKSSQKKRTLSDLQKAARRLTTTKRRSTLPPPVDDNEEDYEEDVVFRFDEEKSDDDDDTGEEAGGQLIRLMQIIDERLASRQHGSSSFASVDFVQYPNDPMGSLLKYNSMKEDKASKATRNIFVLFGKPLINDQVTVEYASRIRSLAMLLLEKKKQPDIVCFCGGVRKNNHISDADAGYMFFKHLCIKEGISLRDTKIYIDRRSKSERKALQNVITHIKSEHIVDWLSISNDSESPANTIVDYGDLQVKRALRKKISLHFTLISTEYHLCNLNDIHHRSPNQSLLRPIEMLRTNNVAQQYEEEKRSKKGRGDNQVINGIIDCSWNYIYACYPFSYSPDITSSFIGRCYLLGEKLRPLLINLKGVVEEYEFLQRDNFMAASSIRGKLVSLMEDLYETSPALRSGLREVCTNDSHETTVEIVLEGATLSLGRCIDLLRPAGLHKSSVSKAQFMKALRSLDHCISQINTYCDPDRPLDLSEWGSLEESFFDEDKPYETNTVDLYDD